MTPLDRIVEALAPSIKDMPPTVQLWEPPSGEGSLHFPVPAYQGPMPLGSPTHSLFGMQGQPLVRPSPLAVAVNGLLPPAPVLKTEHYHSILSAPNYILRRTKFSEEEVRRESRHDASAYHDVHPTIEQAALEALRLGKVMASRGGTTSGPR